MASAQLKDRGKHREYCSLHRYFQAIPHHGLGDFVPHPDNRFRAIAADIASLNEKTENRVAAGRILVVPDHDTARNRIRLCRGNSVGFSQGRHEQSCPAATFLNSRHSNPEASRHMVNQATHGAIPLLHWIKIYAWE